MESSKFDPVAVQACIGFDASPPQNEEEYFHSLIIRCAQAILESNLDEAFRITSILRATASPTGSPTQRMARYFTDAFEARITGKVNNTNTPPKKGFVKQLFNIFQLGAEISPIVGLTIFFTNQIILEHVRSPRVKRIHIVDYGIGPGFRWFCLLKDLSEFSQAPPLLRITGVDFPDFHSSVPVGKTLERLSAYAKNLGVPFEYESVTSQAWELLTPSELGVRKLEDEVFIVTCIHKLKHMKDEPCVDGTPRKQLLRQIVDMRPAVFIQAENTLSCNCPLDLRVRAALEFNQGIFASLEETLPDHKVAERELMEWVLGMDLINMLAFEGEDWIERPECYTQWQILAQNSGLKPLKLNNQFFKKAVEMVGSYNKGFSVAKRSNWYLVYWKNCCLSAVTAWSPSTSYKVQIN